MTGKREHSRAELVRARRAHRVSQAMTQSAQRPFKPVAHVTSRVGTSYMPARQKRDENVHGGSKITFGLPHFSFHRPIIGVARHGYWRIVSLTLVLISGLAIYMMWTMPYFHVPVVTVTGNGRLSREEIEAVLGITGQSIFLVQPDELAVRLRMNYPELTSAGVRVYLPNYVYVDVSERQPVIVWQQGTAYTWIDASGVAFRPRGHVEGLIPVNALATPPAGESTEADPFNPSVYMHKELVDAILLLAPSVPADSTLTYDAKDGLGWTDSRGWNVYFGNNAQDMPLRLRVYQSLTESLIGRGTIPEYINIAYSDAPYYRMAEYAEYESTLDTGQ